MTQAFTHRKSARGFSLLELMVAVTISLLLLMGVVALFVSSRASYETTERLSRIQENGRYALDQFTNDIRAAGYQGCARANPGSARAADFVISSLNNPNALLWNFAVPAQGFNGLGGSTFSPALGAGILNPEPSADGDVVVLRIPQRDAVAMQLTDAQVDAADPLQVGIINPAPIEAGDVAVITDCEARAWFQVTGYAGGEIQHIETGGTQTTPGNSSASLLHPFKRGAEVVPVTTVIYYLAPGNANPELMSLWRKTGGALLSDEIAEGIERLEIRYGIDDPTNGTDGRVDSYVDDVSAVTSWDRVYSLKIALLARAPDAYGTDIDNQVYTLFGAPNEVTAGPFNDRFLRKVFTATVAVRNQIID